MVMNRMNQPPFKHSTPGTVYRMRQFRAVRIGGVKLRKYVGIG